jgi:hypothetical protein
MISQIVGFVKENVIPSWMKSLASPNPGIVPEGVSEVSYENTDSQSAVTSEEVEVRPYLIDTQEFFLCF